MVGNKNPLNSILKSSSWYRMVLWGALVGICSGFVTVFYRLALTWADTLRKTIFPTADTFGEIALLFAFLAAIGIITGKLAESEPLIKGGGIPQLQGQLLGYFSPNCFKVLIKKFISGVLCILGGLSLGRLGPSIQLGAMTADGVCRITKRSNAERKYLLVCGASAGLSAAFNAPLSGLMFALEEVHKNFSARALFPAMLAAIIGNFISVNFFGDASSLHLASAAQLPIQFYTLYLIVGIITGLLGVLYCRTLFKVQKLYVKTGLPLWLRITVPFICAGILSFVLPDILGGGQNIIDALAAGEYSISFIAVLLVVKFAFSMICFCAGAPGGIFFPLLVLGSLTGCLCANAAVALFDLPENYIITFMLMGMAGMFAAVVRAPLTGILLVVEMSGSLTHLMGISIVVCLASLTATLLRCRPVYEQLLDNLTPDPISKANPHREQDIIDLAIPYGSPLCGKHISEISWPDTCLVVSVTRGSDQLIPHGITVIEPGDVLSVVCPVGDEALVQAVAGSTVV